MSGCRIGRVRMKAGGADVRILDTRPRDPMADALMDSAAFAAADDVSIVGYAIVALYADGRTMVGSKTDFVDSCMTRYAFVGVVSERVREHLITEETACDVFNRGMSGDA